MKYSLKRFIARIVALALVIAVIVPGESVAAGVSAPSNLGKHSAYTVMDARTGEVILSDNMNSKIYPASTTKLVTAMVLIDKDKLSKKIKITKTMVKKTPRSASKYGIKAGEKYTLETLLNMILISSSADAAVAAAIGVYGSTKKCVKAMNSKAKKMGLKKTHFDNVIGLDIGDGYRKIYSTSYEMAQFTRYAMSYSTIDEIVARKTYQVRQSNGKKGKVISNTNIFYSSVAYSKDLYSIIGSKTGTTRAAGYVFAATAINKDGHELICTYNGKESKVKTFSDIRKLLDKTYKANKSGNINLSDGTVEINCKFLDKINKNLPDTKRALKITGKAADTGLDLGIYLKDKRSGYKLDSFKGKISCSSSDENIATIDKNGVITLKSEGTVTFTIKCKKSEYFEAASREITLTIAE